MYLYQCAIAARRPWPLALPVSKRIAAGALKLERLIMCMYVDTESVYVLDLYSVRMIHK